MSYIILSKGEFIQSETPGVYSGWGPGKIFGKLDCESGKRMKKENRVFFHNLEDAVESGFRPCKKCHPIDERDFEKIRHLVLYTTLNEFYDSGYKNN